jgi:hypothetical protein
MMKKTFLFIFLLSALFVSCVDSDLPNPNGMWQLKYTIDQNEDKEVIDTVFYSFQRQRLFSYTWLTKNEIGQEVSPVMYGYIDFPDDDTMHIIMDTNTNNADSYQNLPWKGPEVTYTIVRLKSDKMILDDGIKEYHFKKF